MIAQGQDDIYYSNSPGQPVAGWWDLWNGFGPWWGSNPRGYRGLTAL